MIYAELCYLHIFLSCCATVLCRFPRLMTTNDRDKCSQYGLQNIIGLPTHRQADEYVYFITAVFCG